MTSGVPFWTLDHAKITMTHLLKHYRNPFGHATTAGNTASQDNVTNAKVGHALGADIRAIGICLPAECMHVNSAMQRTISSKRLFLAFGSVVFARSTIVLQTTRKRILSVD